MDQPKFCEDCGQKHDCSEVYRQLGKKEGQSVTFKVVVAFLIPILVFIASLVVFEHILAGMIETKELRIAVDFLLAVAVTSAVVSVIKRTKA
ncbi:MAG: hypothetical protein JSV82_03875 [Planctomycetota bacterium]|nr:MAG: hypothetical protein JSV82_03875 [Planctomycetota bacterium]